MSVASQITHDASNRWRSDFPALSQTIENKPLVYLDNAATTQKPNRVIEALTHYYTYDNANIHRGVHTLSERATEAFESAREKVRAFLNAKSSREIIFVRGATEAINLVAQSYGRTTFKAGDEILISAMEHHANIVPWQIVAEQTGAHLRVIPITEKGELNVEAYAKLLNPRVKLVSVAHVSNALGTVNPVKLLVQKAHAFGIPVLLDGAQAVAHGPVDVLDLDCEFYVFSGHKLYGPTGIGVLYGKEALLNSMPPYQAGGNMIRSVTFEKTIYNDLPYKFEAGTPHIAGAIGLGAALDYIQDIGWPQILELELAIQNVALNALRSFPGLRLIGEAKERAGVISFVLENIHPHDVGTILNHQGIAIRTGHHCAQPVMNFFGIAASCRASLALYNTVADVDALIDGLQRVRKVLAHE